MNIHFQFPAHRHPYRQPNRRQFFHLSLFAAASALSWACTQGAAKTSKASILVIGAGIAGLAAARELQSKGFQVTVFEGRDRTGGRIHTDRHLGFPADLGASWIHGITGNPITKLARDFQVRIAPTDYDNRTIYGTDGKSLGDREIERSESLYEEIISQAKGLRKNLAKDISIAEAVERILQGANLTPQQRIILNWQLTSNVVVETGTDLQNLSLMAYDEDEAFGGDDYLFPGGYDAIIQGLAKGIDIQLRQKVTGIEYGNKGVTVKTERGSFQADAAVITLPLGVLKSGSVTFSPPLPERKRAAISRLSMGVLNKVVLKFPKIFWPADNDMIGYISPQSKDFSEFVNLHRHTSAQVLVALTGGSFARELEQLSEREVGERVMKLLRRAHGNGIPNPEAILRTRWAADPFSFGSYSQIPVGSSIGDLEALAEPVADRLFFAGEATSQNYPSTVHGAFLSGIREAEQIGKGFAG
ncbi:MAG: FAD-dependent oxidoreductase [Oscillatoria princeps RMCB-10]|jgi:monoamine oxidase|nr:FAD-dependent oxidoreductase [Oscillatoria princeps RMCB-10]